VEIQALATKSFYGQSRCMTTGMKYDRVSMLIAVLEKRAGLRLGDQDVYLNVVGGLRVDDPACDLAAAMAIASSYLDKCVPQDLLLLGEVGLTGELRQVGQLERRLREAAQMGFRRAIVPKQKKRLEIPNMEIIEESLITSVIDHLWRE
jgi:DNA repair protein RadA/Sms